MNKQILRLAIPNIISNITIPLPGMVDLALLGHLSNWLPPISISGYLQLYLIKYRL